MSERESFLLESDPIDGFPVVAPPKAPAHAIIREVAAAHGLSPDQLLERCRKPARVLARRDAMRRVRDELGYSYPKIGQLFKRDHTTVLWSCRGGRSNQRRGRT